MVYNTEKRQIRTQLRELSIRALLTIGSLSLWACSGTPTGIPLYEEAIDHYRSSQRFEYVFVDVSADLRNIAPVLNDTVAAELVSYLEQVGIEASLTTDLRREATARLEVKINRDHASQVYMPWTYFVYARLIDHNDNIIEEATIYHNAGLSKAPATAQQLAALIVDDMLLIWHPAFGANNRGQVLTDSARFSILPDTLTILNDAQSGRVSWEAFPSERLLEGGDISAENITDVRYQLRLHPVPMAVSGPRDVLRDYPLVHRAVSLTETQYVLPFVLPTCAALDWSVRAHFRLLGHPRVTEWSGRHYQRRMEADSTTSPSAERGMLDHFHGGGIHVDVKPTEKISCPELLGGRWTRSWGPFTQTYDAEKINTTSIRFERLLPGQWIAVNATVNGPCERPDCDILERDKEASEMLRVSLVSAFQDRSLRVAVRNLSGLLAQLPVPLESDTDQIGEADLLNRIRTAENSDDVRGVRYLINTELKTTTGAAEKDAVVSGEGGVPVLGWSSSRPVTTIAHTDIIDVASGEVIGSINSMGEVARGWGGVIIPFPIVLPHGYIADPESKAIKDLAQQLAFALTVGNATTEWSEQYFEDVLAPMWEPRALDR